MYNDYEVEQAFQRGNREKVQSPPPVDFEPLWPSATKGNGRVVSNNSKNGGAQGKASIILKAHCRLCGFPNDTNLVDHLGGSLDGNGAGGGITTATATTTLASGATHTENYGTQAYNKGSGCALCFSKNSTSQRIITTGGNPWNKQENYGF